MSVKKFSTQRYAGQKHRWGFTLIELLLGLSIFSIIMLAVYGTFSGGLLLSQRSEKGSEIYREARWFFAMITKDLENMAAYDFTSSYPDKKPFVGTDGEITFIMKTEGGLKVVSYLLLAPDSSEILKTEIGNVYQKNVMVTSQETQSRRVNYLVRREMDFVDFLNDEPASKDQTELICVHVMEGGLNFSYGFLEDVESKQYSWIDAWDKDYIPSGLRVSVTFLPERSQDAQVNFTKDVLIPTGYWGVDESTQESDAIIY